MSKTLGNGVDPIDVINEYGTDALRFSLILGITFGNDIRYIPAKVEQGSNFANKIWNAAKFILMNIDDEEKVKETFKKIYDENTKTYNSDLLKIEDKWILNKLDKLVAQVTKNYDNYDLGVALDNVYNFIWNEFCDWYIEIVKPRIYSENEEEKLIVSSILNYVFTVALKLLHPVMPFVTSVIYDSLIKFDDKELMVSDWPEAIGTKFDKEETTIEKIKEIIVEIRNVRANMNIHPSKKSELIIVTKDYENEVKEAEEFILKLGFGTELKLQSDKKDVPDNAIAILKDGIEVYIPMNELVDMAAEKERLEGEKAKLEAEVERAEKMLSNPGFVNKAPEAKVNEEKEKLEKYKAMLKDVEDRLANM